MKKNLVALLLVLVVVSFGLFAAPTNPGNVGFDVKTVIDGVNAMSITPELATNETTFNASYTGPALYDGTTVSNLPYISAKSNNRQGFTITMTATAMKSATATSGVHTYIGYTVAAGGSEIEVDKSFADEPVSDSGSNAVLSKTGLTVLSYYSEPVSITVNGTDYADAVEDTYTGTITFNYVATT